MERSAISDKLFTLSVGDRWHRNFCCGCCCTNLVPWIMYILERSSKEVKCSRTYLNQWLCTKIKDNKSYFMVSIAEC